MSCLVKLVLSALWAGGAWAAVAATHPSTPYEVPIHDWTTVESYCWSDTKHNVRALRHHAPGWDTSCATVERCLAACDVAGYCLAGLEYGHECWCGNVVQGDVRPVPDSNCDEPCSGNRAQTCGGHGFLSLYIRRGFGFVIEPPA